MKKYSHLFFDLDHTIWDYDLNSEATIRLLCDQFSINQSPSFNIEAFIHCFNDVNEALWDRYHAGQIGQEHIRNERFKTIFAKLEIEFDSTEDFSAAYISECPRMGKTIPGAIELLEQLKDIYQLHIITNGFPDVQHIKLSTSGLDRFFGETVISSHTDFRKPDKEIFLHALNLTNGKPHSSIMIGDSLESDIKGAKNVPMDQVYFNPKKKPHSEAVTYEICELLEMKSLGF